MKDVEFKLREAGAEMASDWVVEIGPDMYIVYACRAWWIALTTSCLWWRCAKILDQVGMTLQDGHWRCANCVDVWQ